MLVVDVRPKRADAVGREKLVQSVTLPEECPVSCKEIVCHVMVGLYLFETVAM